MENMPGYSLKINKRWCRGNSENLLVSPTFVDGVPVGAGLAHTHAVTITVGGKDKVAAVTGKGKGVTLDGVI